MPNKTRCQWVSGDPLYVQYHDLEWGVPVLNNRKLFEFLILEGMQAGLSWLTILKKREAFRECFDDFDVKKIAQYKQNKINKLIENPTIIRNRLKINATINNAQVYLSNFNNHNSFKDYIWSFTNGKPIQNHWKHLSEVPASTDLSLKLSNDLKKRGFKFVGTTICYAFMQAVGLVNDHTIDCFRHKEIGKRKS